MGSLAAHVRTSVRLALVVALVMPLMATAIDAAASRTSPVASARLAQDPGDSPCRSYAVHLPFGFVGARAVRPVPSTPHAQAARPCAPSPTPTTGPDGTPSTTGTPTGSATGPTPTGSPTPTGPTPTASPTPTGPTPTASPTGPTPTTSPSPSGPTPSPTHTPAATTPAASPSPSATGPTATSTPTQPPTPSPTPSESPTPTPSPTPTVTPPALAFGLQVFEGDVGAIAAGRLNDAGATWGRTRALWRSIEPVDGGPRDWMISDVMISALSARSITAMVSIYAWPSWAASTACGPIDRVPLARYQAFVQDVVERYDGDGVDDAPGSPRAAYWEVGNEPDFAPSAAPAGEGDYGSCFGDDPGAYAELLVATHDGVAAADPTARVLFGGVAHDRFADRPGGTSGPFRYAFVRDVLTALHASHGDHPDFPFVDALGFHNYNDFRTIWDGPGGQQQELIGKAAALRRDQLVVAGQFDLRHLPLVCTEIGIAAGPSDPYTVRSEAYQAAYAGQVAIRALAAGLTTAFWYTTTDYTTGSCADPYAWLTFGLLRSRIVRDRAEACPDNPLPGYAPAAEWEPKPALTAFAASARLLDGAVYDRQLTAAETGDAAIEAHRVTLSSGRQALVAFTDHRERLGRRGWTDLVRDLVVGPALLDGWTGRVRVVDHLGAGQTRSGATVTVGLTHAPVAVVVD